MAMNHSALNLEMERSKLIKTNNPQPLFQEKKEKTDQLLGSKVFCTILHFNLDDDIFSFFINRSRNLHPT